MKLTETELQDLAAQLRKPEGETGIKVGEMMNFTNSNMIAKTIAALQLSDTDTVLEVGPGNAAHVAGFLSEGMQYHGIDISETMIVAAQQMYTATSNAAFTLTDGKTIPFEDGKFSKVFTTNTIYFWEQPQDYTIEIARVMQPGGFIAIGFIPKSSMHRIPFAKFGFTLYDIAAVSQLLNNAGFEMLSAITDTELVLSNSGEQIEREFAIVTAKKL